MALHFLFHSLPNYIVGGNKTSYQWAQTRPNDHLIKFQSVILKFIWRFGYDFFIFVQLGRWNSKRTCEATWDTKVGVFHLLILCEQHKCNFLI